MKFVLETTVVDTSAEADDDFFVFSTLSLAKYFFLLIIKF